MPCVCICCCCQKDKCVKLCGDSKTGICNAGQPTKASCVCILNDKGECVEISKELSSDKCYTLCTRDRDQNKPKCISLTEATKNLPETMSCCTKSDSTADNDNQSKIACVNICCCDGQNKCINVDDVSSNDKNEVCCN